MQVDCDVRPVSFLNLILLMASPCYLWKTDLLLFYDDLQISVPPTLCGFKVAKLVMLAQYIQNSRSPFSSVKVILPKIQFLESLDIQYCIGIPLSANLCFQATW